MFEAEENGLLERLEQIFENFLKPDYTTKHSVYFEKLINHFSSEEHKNVLSTPFFVEFVDKCCVLLQKDFKLVHPQVVAFTYNFTSLLLQNQWIILSLKKNGTLDNLITILNNNVQHLNASMKLGCIHFLKALSEYSVGCAVIGKFGMWRHIIDFCVRDQTVYLVHESRELLYEFLYKLLIKSKDEKQVQEILSQILKPIYKTISNMEEVSVVVDDSAEWTEILATIDLITFILERTIESTEKVDLLKHCCSGDEQLILSAWKLTNFTQNNVYYGKIAHLLIVCNYAYLLEKFWTGSGQILAENFNEFGVNFLNILRFCVSRGATLTFINCVGYNYILWSKLSQRAPNEIIAENERVCFKNLLLIFFMCPMLFYLHQSRSCDTWEEDTFSKNFITKIFQVQSEQSWRLMYYYRDRCDGPREFIRELANKAIKGILSLEHVYEREQAVLVFQALMHLLREFTENLADDLNNTYGEDDVNICYSTLVGMQSLIQRYRITWKECVESICLVNFTVMLLERSMPTRVCVQALKLIQLSIEHFMAPNMALLIDDLNGSSLSCLGPLIVKLVYDPNWEVRDSVLELVNTITQISRLKFPAFQKFLIEHKIFPIVFKMAQNDSEAYVRASAYKCLTSMVGVDKIWGSYPNSIEIIDHLFSVMYNESEGIVRKEAVITMAKIYERHKIPIQYEDMLYSIFTYLVVNDLHWEVTLSALYFWQLEFMRRCTDQGMIDGTFPTVTFSKEHKKIVQLNPREINVRITKIIQEMSARGGLTVIYKCLTEEDCNLGITKTVICLLKCIQSVLKKYNYEPTTEFLEPVANGISKGNSDLVHSADEIIPESIKNSDAIIDEILNERDINYITDVCQEYLQLNGDSTPKKNVDPFFYKRYAHVNTKDLLEVLNTQNLDEFLENRLSWLERNESFESLVEDLWNVTKPMASEALTADCY